MDLWIRPEICNPRGKRHFRLSRAQHHEIHMDEMPLLNVEKIVNPLKKAVMMKRLSKMNFNFVHRNFALKMILDPANFLN
jgi:hypothetical protein